jgi:DNA-binding MarR family transcriptional regulator
MGLVRRTQDSTDGRAVAVELTARGKSLEPSAATVQKAMKSATRLKNEEIANLRDELRDLAERLRDI